MKTSESGDSMNHDSEIRKLKKAIDSEDCEKLNLIFEDIFNTYKGLICFIIAKYIQSQDDIDDLLQDTFLDFFNHAEHVTASIKSYLAIMAKNKAINFLKTRKRYDVMDAQDLELCTADEVKDDYLYSSVLEVLKEGLADLDYKIIYHHLLDNITFKELSIQFNLKESTVKSKYFRAIQKSKKIIERKNLR